MIRRYTVTRIDVDYYVVTEDELTLMICPKIAYAPDLIVSYETVLKWDFVSSYGGRWPEDGIPDEAKKRNPRILLRKNKQSYTFYACVYHFPHPELAGKWKDYTTAYGWE